VFAGEYWFPEPNEKYRNPLNNKYVFPGRPYNWDMTPLYAAKYDEWGPSRHFTNVFNVFVWLQIFNIINCRKINDELNIFEGIKTNPTFIAMWIFITGGQIIIVCFGGYAFKISLDVIAGEQWGIAFAFGFG
jgi:magnesium-transporting ATPase (P-type)